MRREKRKNVVGEWNGDGEDGGIYRGVPVLVSGHRGVEAGSRRRGPRARWVGTPGRGFGRQALVQRRSPETKTC